MAVFLINASNLKSHGGLQMADSVCGLLYRFKEHHFIVVLPTCLDGTAELIKDYNNVEVLHYDRPKSFSPVILGRDKFLDGLVREKKVDAVLTVFGPSLWRPRVPHLCGFARAQLLLKDSPYFDPRFRVNDSWLKRLKEQIVHRVWAWGFRQSSRVFYTENAYISSMLPRLIKGVKV